jgi:hypothetical protein
MEQGVCTCTDFSVGVKYSEFADDSFENKLKNLGEAYIKGTISTDMYLSKLYGESLSSDEKEKEKKYLEAQNQESDMPGMGDMGGMDELDMGDEKPGFKGVDVSEG